MRYSLVSGGDAGFLTVDAVTGEVRTASVLCHVSNPTLTVVVMATDGSNGVTTLDVRLSTTTTINVTVRSVNVHRPVFVGGGASGYVNSFSVDHGSPICMC